MIKATVAARTKEGHAYDADDAKAFAGAQAAICYSDKPYAEIIAQDKAMRIKRAENTVERGHHSVMGPYHVTLVLEGIPKIAAMTLNSLGEYSTLERSARYTAYKPQNEREAELYGKWRGKIAGFVKKHYPSETEKGLLNADKLALENARYMLSVFTPTTMSYTTSARQFAYISHWLSKLCGKLGGNKFDDDLREALKETRDAIMSVLPLCTDDGKRREIDFFTHRAEDGLVQAALDCGATRFGPSSYEAGYSASFAAIAQLQRHRTIKYRVMFAADSSHRRYRVPEIVKREGMETEWREDIKSLEDITPQGTLAWVFERGDPEATVLRCAERLCGRTQHETMTVCRDVLTEYVEWAEKNSPELLRFFEDRLIGKNGKIGAKCGMGFPCNERCAFGAERGIDRII
jgi:hypothetical protein